MNEQYVKTAAARDYTGPATDAAHRDPARILDMLAQAHVAIGRIEESVGIARDALWGPMPTADHDRLNNLKTVEPSGFLPAAMAKLAALMQRLEALDASARHLRNL